MADGQLLNSSNIVVIVIAALIAGFNVVKAIADAAVEIFAPAKEPVVCVHPNVDLLLDALRGLVAIRPSNWADEDDVEQVTAWEFADAAIAKVEGGE